MTITKLKGTPTSENWYHATETLPNGATANGFGSTYALALADCLRDVAIINKLKAK